MHTTIVHPAFVRTPLVKDVAEGEAGQILEPEEIADPILRQIFSCRSAQLILPVSLGWISLLKGLPHWAQNGFRNMLSKQAFPS